MKCKLISMVVIGFVVSLTGCGGGSNSTSAPANTKTTYSITNKTEKDFATVVVVDGNTGIETQSGSLNCPAQSVDCVFYYTGQQINGPDSLLFKDVTGRVVAAYVNAYDQSEHDTLIVTPWTTGLYLFQQLGRQNALIGVMSQSEIESRLHVITLNYESPDGPADYFEEIAAHYYYVLQNTNYSTSEFLDRFAERLLAADVPDASEFAKIQVAQSQSVGPRTAFADMWNGKMSLMNLAHADSSSCPAGLAGFLDFFGAAAGGVKNAFPVAGTVAQAVHKISTSVCGSGQPSLADIMNKLNAIQNSLDALHDKLGQMLYLTADTNINAGLSQFGRVAKESNTRGDNYNALVKGNTKSLLQYVKELDSDKGGGTLEYVLKKYPSGTLSNLMKSVLDSEGLISKIDALTDEKFNTMTSSIRAKCGSITVGDAVSIRTQCNLAVSTSMGRLISSQSVARKIAKDVYAVAEAFPDEVANQYGFSGTAKDAIEALETKFAKQLSDAKDKYQAMIVNSNASERGYYNVYDGISPILISKMKEVACWDSKLDTPAIGKWEKESNGNLEYFETNCRVGDVNGPFVRARYFRKIDGANVGNDDVANVMGVLVERRYVTGNDFWYVGSRYTTGFQVGHFYQKVGWGAYGNQFAINNTDLRDSNIVRPNTTGTRRQNLKMIAPQAPGYEHDVSQWEIDWNNESTPVKNWMRYTDTAGYSYVFYLASYLGFGYTKLVKLYCVTGDCKQEGHNSSTDYYLTFNKGPKKLGGFGDWTIDGKRIYQRVN